MTLVYPTDRIVNKKHCTVVADVGKQRACILRNSRANCRPIFESCNHTVNWVDYACFVTGAIVSKRRHHQMRTWSRAPFDDLLTSKHCNATFRCTTACLRGLRWINFSSFDQVHDLNSVQFGVFLISEKKTEIHKGNSKLTIFFKSCQSFVSFFVLLNRRKKKTIQKSASDWPRTLRFWYFITFTIFQVIFQIWQLQEVPNWWPIGGRFNSLIA